MKYFYRLLYINETACTLRRVRLHSWESRMCRQKERRMLPDDRRRYELYIYRKML